MSPRRCSSVLLLFCLTLPAAAAVPASSPAQERQRAVRGAIGTYNASPRAKDGHVDLDRLLAELREIKANTYNWLVWRAETDWDDLQKFLPLAQKAKIRVWVSLVPPSESPPKAKQYSEPFRLDYEKWASEIAKLSTREPALVAWSIDDFAHNLKVYTPEKMRAIQKAAHDVNPRLAFVPCLYYRQINAKFAEDYRGLLDGVLFPYRNESVKADLKDPSHVEQEVKKVRELMGADLPVLVDVYATAHSQLGASTPEYVREVMKNAKACADGVLIYCHQDKKSQAAKYDIIRELFNEWAK